MPSGYDALGTLFPGLNMEDSESLQSLAKALYAGSETDLSTVTGGQAFATVDISPNMARIVQRKKDHFWFWDGIAKPKMTNIMTYWPEQSAVGSKNGLFTGQDALANQSSGTYNLRNAVAKMLSTRRDVTYVKSIESNVGNIKAVTEEETNGMLEILTEVSRGLYFADSSINSYEFDGLHAVIADRAADNIIDCEGTYPTIDKIRQAARIISNWGAFGKPTHMSVCLATKSLMNRYLDPAARWTVDGNPQFMVLGSDVSAIQTAFGPVKVNYDLHLRPFCRDETGAPTGDKVTNPAPPTSVTAAAASDTDSTIPAGDYYYRVESYNHRGYSTSVVLASAVTVAALQKVTLTITASAENLETGYLIYRSATDGANTAADMRFVARVAKAGATTTYVDINQNRPGCTSAFMFSMTPGEESVQYGQYIPPSKFNLYPAAAAVIPFLMMMMGVPVIKYPTRNIEFKNTPYDPAWLGLE